MAPGLDAASLSDAYQRISLGSWQVAASSVMFSPSGSRAGHDVWREHWHEALAVCGYHDEELTRVAFEVYRRDRLTRYRLYSDGLDTLRRLRELVDGIGVVTNGPGDTQREKIAATGLLDYIDVVVTSGETGHAKPEPEIFGAALRELNADPDQAWHVGDSLSSDIAGACNAGLAAAVWLEKADVGPPARHIPSYRVNSLRGLLTVMS